MTVRADTVVLHNGNRIHGEVLREGPRQLALKFSGGIIQIPRKQIERVERESRINYLIELSETQMGRSSFEDALKTLEDAEREAPDSSRVHEGLIDARHGLGNSLTALQRYGEAREVFERVLTDDPEHVGATTGIRQIDALLSTAHREEKAARLEIRRGGLESGVGRLNDLYDRFPERREALAPVLADALAGWGNTLLGQGDWEGAEKRYASALEVHPEIAPKVSLPFSAIKLHRAQELASEGRFPDVAEAATAGLEVAPAHKGLRFYAALALESKGEKKQAALEYLAISGMRRPARPADSVGELRRAAEAALVEAGKVKPTAHPKAREASGSFRKLQTRHFEIIHRNDVVAREIADVAEQDYTRLFRKLRCETDLRTRIRITAYPTQQEYLDASGMASWSGGAHKVKARGDMSEHEIFCYQDQARLLTGILTHEIAHALLAHRVNYESIPLWANEGYAVHTEPRHLHSHYMKILKKEKGRRTLVPLRKLLGRQDYPENDVSLYYGQSFSVVSFLIEEKGVQTFVRFLLSLNGDNLSAMLERHYKLAGLDALENRWLAWVDFWR